MINLQVLQCEVSEEGLEGGPPQVVQGHQGQERAEQVQKEICIRRTRLKLLKDFFKNKEVI